MSFGYKMNDVLLKFCRQILAIGQKYGILEIFAFFVLQLQNPKTEHCSMNSNMSHIFKTK